MSLACVSGSTRGSSEIQSFSSGHLFPAVTEDIHMPTRQMPPHRLHKTTRPGSVPYSPAASVFCPGTASADSDVRPGDKVTQVPNSPEGPLMLRASPLHNPELGVQLGGVTGPLEPRTGILSGVTICQSPAPSSGRHPSCRRQE